MENAPHAFHKELTDTHLSQEEAIEYGKSLRDKTPRVNHAGWQAPPDRRDPIDILIETSKDRLPNLIPIRYGRMLQSSFAFFRGTAAIMASDLATTPNTGLYVQACGDCHLLNFGVFGTPERSLIFDINDFDETLPAPWEWDIKRLATSFVIASRNNNFSQSVAKEAAAISVEAYRTRTAEYAKMSPLDIWYSHISVDDILTIATNEKVKKRLIRRVEKAKAESSIDTDFPQLTQMKYGKAFIKDNPPLIFHRTDVDPKEYHAIVEAAFERYMTTLGEEKRILLGQYEFQDMAIKVVGIGSVGTRCSVSLRMSANNDPLFLQVKQANPSVLEPYAGKSHYDNHAQRIVAGQKLMQAASDIFLGFSDLIEGHYFYVRQLHDMKIKAHVETFEEESMLNFARLCGWALARAHARSGKASIISGYLGNSAKFDDAVTEFALDYADQNEKDYTALKNAVAEGKIEAYVEE